MDESNGLVVVEQSGCRLGVTLSSNDIGDNQIKTEGTIDGVLLQVLHVDSLGVIIDSGDVKFQNGKVWTKQACPDISGDYLDNVQRIISLRQTDCHIRAAMASDGSEQEGDIVGAFFILQSDRGKLLQNGDIEFADGEAWRQRDCDDITGQYVDAGGNTVNVSQYKCRATIELASQPTRSGRVRGDILEVDGFQAEGKIDKSGVRFVDGGAWDKRDVLLQEVKEACADVSGEYVSKDDSSLQISQQGCAITVTTETEWGKQVSEGKVKQRQVFVAGHSHPGDLDEGGNVVFMETDSWTKKKACEEVNGTWFDKIKAEFKITQEGCKITVESWGSSKPVRDGSIAGSSITLEGMDEKATLVDGVVSFADGQQWRKQDCADLSGRYNGEGGSLVVILLDVCDVTIDVTSKTEVRRYTGRLEKSELHVEGFSAVGRASNNSTIAFDDGATWTKQACEDLSGIYTDVDMNMVTIRQAGCELMTEVASADSKTVSRTATASGDMLQVDGFQNSGLLARRTGDIDFNDGGRWIKKQPVHTPVLTHTGDEECDDITGTYIDHTGAEVVVTQKGCYVVAKSQWEGKHVAFEGGVRGHLVHIDGFSTDGKTMWDGGVRFNDGGHWMRADAEGAPQVLESGNAADDKALKTKSTATTKKALKTKSSATTKIVADDEALESGKIDITEASADDEALETESTATTKKALKTKISATTKTVADDEALESGKIDITETSADDEALESGRIDITEASADDEALETESTAATETSVDGKLSAATSAHGKAAKTGKACADISGTFSDEADKDMRFVIVQQGCEVSVTNKRGGITWGGKLEGSSLKVETFQADGAVKLDGGKVDRITFSDGGKWTKQACPDVSGIYEDANANGRLVIVKQSICNVTIEAQDPVVNASGLLNDHILKVRGFTALGDFDDELGSIKFRDGAEWVQASEKAITSDDAVCLSIVAAEEPVWIDALLKNALAMTDLSTKIAVHLNADTHYPPAVIQRWNKTARVIITPQRIKVAKFHGSILLAHLLNTKYLGDDCSYVVMQASNMMWVRQGMTTAVRRHEFGGFSVQKGKLSSLMQQGLEHPFFANVTSIGTAKVAWGIHEGAFFKTSVLRMFHAYLNAWLKDQTKNFQKPKAALANALQLLGAKAPTVMQSLVAVKDAKNSEEAFQNSVKILFDNLAHGGEGITQTDFEGGVHDERFFGYINAAGLNFTDARALFNVIDFDGSKDISNAEFNAACKSMEADVTLLDDAMMAFHVVHSRGPFEELWLQSFVVNRRPFDYFMPALTWRDIHDMQNSIDKEEVDIIRDGALPPSCNEDGTRIPDSCYAGANRVPTDRGFFAVKRVERNVHDPVVKYVLSFTDTDDVFQKP